MHKQPQGSISISKRIHFDAAHALHSAKDSPECERIHGHRWEVELTVELKQACWLNDEGMALNFAVIKKMLGYIHDLFDHNFVNDVELPTLEALGRWSFNYTLAVGSEMAKAQGESFSRVYASPTVENLAIWIGECLAEQLSAAGLLSMLNVKEITVWETPTSRATYSPAVKLESDLS